MESVQYPSKDSFVVSNFEKPKENLDVSSQHQHAPAAKKRRIRSPLSSPLKNLPASMNLNTSPQSKVQESPRKFEKFPSFCTTKTLISPRKSLMSPSPRKLVISPRKFMSPTALLPNLVMNGKSPHLPNRSTGKKKEKENWLTALQSRKRAKCED